MTGPLSREEVAHASAYDDGVLERDGKNHGTPTTAESRRRSPVTDRLLSRRPESARPMEPVGESEERIGRSNVPADHVRIGGPGILGVVLMSAPIGRPCPRLTVLGGAIVRRPNRSFG